MKVIIILLFLLAAAANGISQSNPVLEPKIQQSSKTVIGGKNLSFSVQFRNVGNSKATKLIVISSPLGFVEIKSIKTNQGTCALKRLGLDPRIRCVFSTLNPGRSVRIDGIFKTLPVRQTNNTPNEQNIAKSAGELLKSLGIADKDLPTRDNSTLIASFYFSFDEDPNPSINYVDLRAEIVPVPPRRKK